MESALAFRCERLTAPVAAPFLDMTFPAYRHLLSLEVVPRHPNMSLLPPVRPVAVGAVAGDEPAGLALAEIPEGQREEAEVLSLFVRADLRGRGVATRLLAAVENELGRLGARRLKAVYMTGQPSEAALERLIGMAGWDPPTTRKLSLQVDLPDFPKTDWYGRFPLGPGLSVFPWSELTREERQELERSQRESPWIPPNLEPWRHDRDGFEPVSSLGVRFQGRVVGWVLNHALSERVVRFTCSFIRKDLGRRGRLVPVYSESIRRLFGTGYESCSFTVPLQHEGMTAFALRRIAPWARYRGETRGTQKSLR